MDTHEGDNGGHGVDSVAYSGFVDVETTTWRKIVRHIGIVGAGGFYGDLGLCNDCILCLSLTLIYQRAKVF